jgi:arylsulfatase A-like enzyme
MNKIHILGSAFLSVVQLNSMAEPAPSSKGKKPNILIILADDLGYGDVQCNNPLRGKIPTPNIDRLATQGMRFTDGHSSSAVSSPSRYTLLTGRYHWRTRLQSGIVNVFGEPLIAPDRLTISSLVKQQGYQTACIGKWHLGWDWPVDTDQRKQLQTDAKPGKDDEGPETTIAHQKLWQDVFSKPIAGGPTTRGFDTYFGTDVPNWPPFCFIENDHTIGIPSVFLPPENFRKTLASLNGPALKDWKLENILPSLGDRAVSFLDEATLNQKPFLLYLPLTAPHTPIAVNNNWQGKSGLNAYADFVMETDALVGRVLEALEKSGQAENTLVFFTSDNGCTPIIGVEALESMGHFPSASFRGYKGDTWEGGHRVPFIVRWPGVIKSGSLCNQLVHHADLIATIAAILGTKLPDNSGEDSFSMLSLFKGKDNPIRENAVSCSVTGVPALRMGDWKLIAGSGSGNMSKFRDDNTIKLFNLKNDPGETMNLAENQHERVKEMKALLENLISNGRSNQGLKQGNDVQVRRHPVIR